MSVSRKRICIGSVDCGGIMSRKIPFYVHVMGMVVMGASMLFSYAALLQNGVLPGVIGFGFGVIFLLLMYGHHMDVVYFHVGNKIKIGGESYDPEREVDEEAYIAEDGTFVEIDENDDRR